ncbi:hypothetical protein HUJ05_003563 [Dendroctonus ponderosae]|nr:hypothetical protein HUJ05_003563 [Dendroctonus ponderosae]
MRNDRSFAFKYPTDSKNVDKADAHDDSVNKELNTDLKRHSEEAKVTNTSDEDNVGTSLEPSSEYKTAGDEPFPTNDESIIIVTPVKSVKSLSPVNKCQDFITVRRKREEKKTLDCPATPTDQNIESQMKVMLDSIYGKSWRAHQQKVFLPMSERKVKRSDNIPIVAPITERIIKPPFKNTLLPNKKLTHTKLNFDSLKKPVKSPWISKLKGLVDSDSADEGNNTKDIKKVKSRLNFGDKTPTKKSVKSNHYEENTANVKHLLKECNIKANIPAKANLQKQYYYQNIEKGANTIGKRRTESSSSITTDEEYDKEIEILELTRNKTVREKNKKYSFLESLSGFIGYLKYYNINVTRTAEGRFEEAVIDYLFTVYLVPIFVNILALYEAKKQANVLTQMVSFERIYTRMFKKRIGFDLGSKPLVMTVVLLILGCGVMVITHFSMANFIIYQVVPYCYINVITFIIGGAWYIYCDIIGNIATCLAEEFQFALRNIEYSNRVCDYRSLWMILSKIIRNVGNSFGYTLTFLCLYLFFVITLTVYGLLSQIQEGMGVKDIGLTITGVSATLMLYFICDEAHYASTCVSQHVTRTSSVLYVTDVVPLDVFREFKIVEHIFDNIVHLPPA